MINRRTCFVGAILATLFSGVAFAEPRAADWGGVEAAANVEGRLSVYSTLAPDQNDRLATAFNEKYPDIRISVTRGVADLLSRVAAEAQTGTEGGDLLVWADTTWFTNNVALLQELATPNFDMLPKAAQLANGKAGIVAYAPLGLLVWNTRLYPTGLKTWDDLLKPELQGKIGTRDGVTASLSGYMDFMESHLGLGYMEALGKQKPKFYASSVPLSQAVAAGEVWASNIGNMATISALQAQGAPIAYEFPKPSYASPLAAGLLANSKHPNAAALFFEFMISEEGQRAMTANDSGVPAFDGMEGLRAHSEFVFADDSKFSPERKAHWEAFIAQFMR
jgi:iron(III) transport system substrate-binding protein